MDTPDTTLKTKLKFPLIILSQGIVQGELLRQGFFAFDALRGEGLNQ